MTSSTKPPRLAIILPSRNLVFSQTVAELFHELQDRDYEIFWSHGRPIPECFNVPTEAALADPTFTHLLTVEEDMIIHPGILDDMLDVDADAVTCDYPVTADGQGSVLYDSPDTAFYTGCGFLLIKTDLLHQLPKPIWRADIEWHTRRFGSRYRFSAHIVDDRKNYGQQDVAFGLRLYYNNRPIRVLSETLGQRKLVTRGEPGTNQGCHAIEDYLIITNRAEPSTIQDAEFQNIYELSDWLAMK